MKQTCLNILTALALALSGAGGGCEKKQESAKADSRGVSTDRAEHADHHPGDGHDHDGHDHGPTTDLGEQSIDGFVIRVTRDGGVRPGGDVPIDAWITGDAEIAAVRFWIGTQDARGSVKARAEIEKDNWHTHAEAPSPLPDDCRIWVEVETTGGRKIIAGFNLGNG